MKNVRLKSLMALVLAGAVGSACSSKSDNDDDNAGGSGGGENTAGTGGNNTAGTGGNNTAGTGGNNTAGMGGNNTAGMGGNAAGSGGQAAAVTVASEFTCPAGMQWGDPLPAEAMRKLTLVKDGLKGGEGGIWVESEKALFFSDLQRDAVPPVAAQLGTYWRMPSSSKIWKHTPEDSMTVEWLPGGGANGMALSADFKKLVVAHIADQSITAIALADKSKMKVADKYMGASFKVTNDLAVRSDGHVYFSDPLWQSHLLGDPNECQPTEGMTKVFHAKPDGTVELVDDKLHNPNGVAMSPDGKTLYVTSLPQPMCGSGPNFGKITKYEIKADGSTGPGMDFITAGVAYPDGLTVDCAGNVYVTSGTVKVFDKDGAALGEIGLQAGGEGLSNVAFGGTDRKTLFAMMKNAVASIKLNVPGPN